MDEAGSTGLYEVLLVLRGFIGLGEVLLGRRGSTGLCSGAALPCAAERGDMATSFCVRKPIISLDSAAPSN